MPAQDNGPIDPAAVEAAKRQMFGSRSEREARRILESLCDPTRLKIVRALTETPLAASDLARVLGRSRAATSQHLRVLREAGAVVAQRSGNVVRYRLSDSTTADVLAKAGEAFDKIGDAAK